MIRINEITITSARKVNLGDFENKDHFIAVKAELTEGSLKELSVAYAMLQAEVDEMIDKWVKKTKEAGK